MNYSNKLLNYEVFTQYIFILQMVFIPVQLSYVAIYYSKTVLKDIHYDNRFLILKQIYFDIHYNYTLLVKINSKEEYLCVCINIHIWLIL